MLRILMEILISSKKKLNFPLYQITFYTTKKNGTGLGLSTVTNIVKKHEGFIEAQSEVGKGAKFQIYIPTTCLKNVAVSEIQKIENFESHGETILIIEDEGFLRDSIAEALENRGFFVIKAKDGIEGISVYSTDHQKISLILVDMMMPVLDGASTVATLKSIDPDVKVIAMSGFVDDEKIEKLASVGVSKILKKPYTENELLSEVQIALR